MGFAPFLSLFNWYWMMDSKIIFNNAWSYKMAVTDNMWSNHIIEVTGINQATPLLYYCFIAVLVTLVNQLLSD